MKKQIWNKGISLLLAVFMVFSMLPFGAFAEDVLPEEPAGGNEEVLPPENEEEPLDETPEEDPGDELPEEPINNEPTDPSEDPLPEEPAGGSDDILPPDDENGDPANGTPEEEPEGDPDEKPEEEPEIPTDEELEQDIPEERIQQKDVSLLPGESGKADFAPFTKILKISVSDEDVVTEVIVPEEDSEEEEDEVGEEVADSEETGDDEDDSDEVPQIELKGGMVDVIGFAVVKVFYLNAEGEKALYVYTVSVEKPEEEPEEAPEEPEEEPEGDPDEKPEEEPEEELEKDIPEERIHEKEVFLPLGESGKFAFAPYSEILKISVSDQEVISSVWVFEAEENSEDEESSDASPQVELGGSTAGTAVVKVFYLNAEGEKCLYIYNADVGTVQKKTVSVLVGQSRQFAFVPYSAIMEIRIADSEIISRAEVIDPEEEDNGVAPQLELEGNLEGSCAVEVYYLNAEGQKSLYIYNATVRSSSGLLGAATAFTLYDNEVGAALNLVGGNNPNYTKFTITNFTSTDSSVIAPGTDKTKPTFIYNDSTKSNSYWGAVLYPLKAGTTTITVGYSYIDTKGQTKTGSKEFNVTVKASAGVSSTVQFRIVNGTWKTNYDGIPASNVSEDGTTITFTTYPDIKSKNEGMYYFNCSRTHDTDINNTNCISMEKVLLAILGDDSGEYIIPDTGFYVDFDYQDWTIDSGSALGKDNKDLYGAGTKSGRNQMQQVANGIHCFDDNGHDTIGDNDSQGFKANTIYTITLLKEPYDDDKKVNYTVHYYLEGTTNKVFDDKTVLDKQAGTPYSELALEKTGYTVDATKKSITPKLNETNEITFYYSEPKATIYYESEDTSKGTVSFESETLSLTGTPEGSTATPEAGYHFVEWKKGSTQVSTDAEYKPSSFADGDTYTAYFAENDSVTINYVALTGGSVSNDKDENIGPATGNPAGSTASADTFYIFDGWYSDAECTQKVGTDATFKPSKDATDKVYKAAIYYAKFLKSELKVTKTSDVSAGTKVKAGDTINYTIKVENIGSTEITDIKVSDEMGRSGATVVLATGESWTIDSLAAGASKELHATYEVTAEDVAAGEVTNAATISEAKDPDGEMPDVDDDDGKTEDPTAGALKVTKTSDVAAGTKVKAGDTINYTITVENIGSTEITDIKVSDEM
ncbi:MAG: hypothetical protein Q4F31_00055, partial [Eubacteriales bacterium]|nr:hypothetical protein [Eubacteriales bacterium]